MNRWTRVGCRVCSVAAAMLIAALVMPGAACSVLVVADREQCESDADCTSRGSQFADYQCVNKVCEQKPADPTWSCLGNVLPRTAEPRPVTVTLTFQHLVTQRPVANVPTQICEKFDINCTTPRISNLTSDAQGTLTFQVTAGFAGYAMFQPPGLIPGSYFFFPAITEDRIVPPIPVIEMEPFVTLAKQSGIEVLPDRGHVLLAAYNCKEEVSEGIRLSSPQADPQSKPFYIIGGLPTTTANETDKLGWAGIVNLPLGTANIVGTVPALGDRQSGMVSVVIKPNELTYTALHPSEN